jgi:RNA-directed DNA polymerase
VVKRKTSTSRLSRGLRAINQWCRKHRHDPLAEQQQALSRKIRGHCAYYGISGNSQSLSSFRLWLVRTWRVWLSRRNRERGMTWDRFNRLLESYPLPGAVAIHSVCRPRVNP